jgi:ribonuclease P protein component
LLRSLDFQQTTRNGHRITVRGFVVFLAAAGLESQDCARLGLTVSRRVGNAVVRNHVKRRIREWFRNDAAKFDEPVDIVVIGRQSAAKMTGSEISRELSHATDDLLKEAS